MFAILIGFTVDRTEMSSDNRARPASDFPYTAISFLIGSLTSILAGWIGMSIATYTNARTTYQCCKGEMLDAAVASQEPGEGYLNMLRSSVDEACRTKLSFILSASCLLSSSKAASQKRASAHKTCFAQSQRQMNCLRATGQAKQGRKGAP